MAWAAHQMRQVYTDYHVGINPQEITLDEIRFFYMPMVESLCEIQRQAQKAKKR
jgi:hypothetical protein